MKKTGKKKSAWKHRKIIGMLARRENEKLILLVDGWGLTNLFATFLKIH